MREGRRFGSAQLGGFPGTVPLSTYTTIMAMHEFEEKE